MKRGKIKAESKLYHLSDAPEVLAKLAIGEILGRAVLVPDDFDINSV
jgi:D-arabinose 1-dehydrogenase-like Zn-dependent alcohol dehydrogenase